MGGAGDIGIGIDLTGALRSNERNIRCTFGGGTEDEKIIRVEDLAEGCVFT